MKRKAASFLALGLLIFGAVSCGAGGGGGGTSAPTPLASLPAVPSGKIPALPPTNTIYLGAFVNPQGLAGGAGPAGYAAFEAQVGRKMALDVHFYGWTDSFPGPDEVDDLNNGRIPVESWNCGVPNAEVASGAQDDNIAKHARSLAAYGGPVFVRYQWEMNLASNPGFRPACYDPNTDSANGFFSPTEFIAAWDRIRAVFASVGANNVIWLWNISGKSPNPVFYYPGASEVDWVGMDDYDDANTAFAPTYATAYTEISPLNKPILICETGAQASVQVAFFSEAIDTLKTQYPLVRGFTYFDAVGNQADWTLSSAGLTAFAAMATDPYVSAMYSP